MVVCGNEISALLTTQPRGPPDTCNIMDLEILCDHYFVNFPLWNNVYAFEFINKHYRLTRIRIKKLEPLHQKPTICICENKGADQLRSNKLLACFCDCPGWFVSDLVGTQSCCFSHAKAHEVFLAHLSRRLTGELIVYPCSGVRPSSVRRPSVVRPSSVRRSHFQRSSPLKPLGQSKPNFIWSIHRKGERKFI